MMFPGLGGELRMVGVSGTSKADRSDHPHGTGLYRNPGPDVRVCGPNGTRGPVKPYTVSAGSRTGLIYE